MTTRLPREIEAAAFGDHGSISLSYAESLSMFKEMREPEELWLWSGWINLNFLMVHGSVLGVGRMIYCWDG